MPALTKPLSIVTGGGGFLGSHLTDRLLAEDDRVVAIDNLITGNLGDRRSAAVPGTATLPPNFLSCAQRAAIYGLAGGPIR